MMMTMMINNIVFFCKCRYVAGMMMMTYLHLFFLKKNNIVNNSKITKQQKPEKHMVNTDEGVYLIMLGNLIVLAYLLQMLIMSDSATF